MSEFKVGDRVELLHNERDADGALTRWAKTHKGAHGTINHIGSTLIMVTWDGLQAPPGMPKISPVRLKLVESAKKFKEGDRVELLPSQFDTGISYNNWALRHQGAQGTVTEVDSESRVTVAWDEDIKPPLGSIRTRRLKLVESSVDPIIDPVFKVGDRVRLVGTDFEDHWSRKHEGSTGTIIRRDEDTIVRVEWDPGQGAMSTGPDKSCYIRRLERLEPDMPNDGITPHDADILGDLLNLGWAERERDDNAVILVDASEAVAVLLQVYTGAPVEHGPTIKVAHMQHQETYNWPRVMNLPTPKEAVVYWQKVRDTYAEGNITKEKPNG